MYDFYGGWVVLETLDTLINWLIKKKVSYFSSVSSSCEPGVSN